MSLWKIIDDRWDRLLHRPLHVAEYFLNPQLHYALGFTIDLEVRNGFFDAKGMMIFKINLILMFRWITPADWWDFFGDETLELKRFALRVYTKRRNKLMQETMNGVIFVMANSKLSKKKQVMKGVKLTIDDIPSDDEWVATTQNSTLEIFSLFNPIPYI
ncbi:hypothetical protein Lal_00039371 [Lupinus albus]|nr:hypothetical protein Lal_00039371 [Lupinus albus]